MSCQNDPEALKQNFNYQKIVLLVGVVLMSMKFIAWAITGSVSIFTDALESIVNVVAAVIGLYALYLSSVPRDASHPFGHGKIENISSLIEGAMIVVAGLIILLEAVERFINPQDVKSLDIGLIIMGVAALANFAIGYIAILKGRRSRSPVLVAAGKHLCSDTLFSTAIIVGLVIMMILDSTGNPMPWIDGLLALIAGMIITFTGVKVVKESMDSSMDKADMKVVEEILDNLKESRHGDWIDIHNLRVIKYGPLMHIQFHIVLSRRMTVEDVYNEVEELRDSIRRIYGDYIDIIVMADPCTDEFCPHCGKECPNRKAELESLPDWTLETVCHEDTTLH